MGLIVSKILYQQMENNYLDVIEQVAIKELENFNHISGYREGQLVKFDELKKLAKFILRKKSGVN
ncbi:hypothetical protein [Xylocopilactobacillus apicola]|uniref:Uncharacterized protein n=1 Tax=Xylocopilactobacillus apicola TaxID=2932184 RepID=A0AAU9DGI8_9LACO|nr:hypothetical protein [Xylocopilactobacillus apicola]BDR59070.1 hypothetical protein XA3_15110 [Xylocopilactobacillus apicola]